MSPEALLEQLARWRAAGRLRALDLAFARFVHAHDANAPAGLLLAAALVSQLEGRGHACLPIEPRGELAATVRELLGWPAEAAGELAEALAETRLAGAAPAAAWAGCLAVQIEPAGERATTPLVASGGRLYLRRLWRQERQVAREVLARAAEARSDAAADRAAADPSPGAIDTDPVRIRRLVDELFPSSEFDWQKVAAALVLQGRLVLLTGGPGTGKTHTAARLLVLLEALQRRPGALLRVGLAAPTGKAAARLRESIARGLQSLEGSAPSVADAARALLAELPPARTLHALLGARPGTQRLRHHGGAPLELDLLFVDEASMVHLGMMAALLEALPRGARLVLLGDPDQLASVEAGAVLADLCPARTGDGAASGAATSAAPGRYRPETATRVAAWTGLTLPAAVVGPGSALEQQTVRLTRSHRFDGVIAALADDVNRGDAGAAARRLREPGAGALRWLASADPAAGYRAYAASLAERPRGRVDAATFEHWVRQVLERLSGHRVLCALRDGPAGVGGLNAAIERELAAHAGLAVRGEWYEGRPVMVTRNEASLGLYNGDVGVVLSDLPVEPSSSGGGAGRAAGPLRAWFADGPVLRSVPVSVLAEVETAFAATVHKSQGSEFEHVLLVLPADDSPVLTRELLYTGITRARRRFTLVCPDEAVWRAAVQRVTRRASGLRALLQARPGVA